MKKIISFILCLCMAVTFVSVNAEENSEAHESYTVLKAMGLIEKESGEEMTRAEFAQLIYDIKHFADTKIETDSWSDNFFGDLAMESELIPEEGTKFELFNDVDPNDEHTAAITELVNIGIMNGVSDTEFSPDTTVKNVEIIKTVLNLMGYKTLCNINGGYVTGYLQTAADLKISDGVDTSQAASATAGVAARIIYNAFDVKLMKLSIKGGEVEYVTDEKNTLLNKIMKADYVTGILTDNGITSLYGASDAGVGKVICGGSKFSNKGDFASNINDCLGYNVKLFYYAEGDMENEAICALKQKKNGVLTIDIESYEGYENNIFTYETDSRQKNVKISPTASFILNGAAVTSVPEDIFDFNNGYVTLIAPNGSDYETVIIKSYVSMYVGSVDTKNHIIYNKAYSATDAEYPASFSVDEAYEAETLAVKNIAGESVGLEGISKGNVIDVSKNGNVIEIIVSANKVEKFKIESKSVDNGVTILKGAGAEYDVDKAYEVAENQSAYGLGDTITLFTNSFGKVVWIEKESDYTLNVGYVLKTVFDEMENDGEGACFIKLIDTDGKCVKYYCADKVRFGDSETQNRTNYKKLNSERVYKYMQAAGQGIIGYGLNDNKEIDIIELPLTERGGENRLQIIYNSGTEKVIYKNDAGGKFKDFTWTDNNTRVFTVPTAEADLNNENRYSCIDKTTLFFSDGTYPILSYCTSSEGIRAEYMVLKKDVKNSLTFKDVDNQYFIVTNVSEGLDDEDEPAVEISGYKTSAYKGANQGLTEMVLYAKNDAGTNAQGVTVNPALYATATIDMANETPKYYKVKKGDIIRYKYDADEAYPTGIEIFYRADTEGDFGGAKGALPGVKQYADSNTKVYNIFAFKDSNGTLTNDVTEYNTYGRVVYSWLYSISKDIGIMTNRDLTLFGYDSTLGVNGYVPIQTGATKVTVTYDNKSVSAALATVNDYKPYKDYGKECSKILTVTQNGWTTFTFVINGEM